MNNVKRNHSQNVNITVRLPRFFGAAPYDVHTTFLLQILRGSAAL